MLEGGTAGVPLECSGFEAFQCLLEPSCVGLLCPCEGLKPLRYVIKALFPCYLCKARIHLGVFVCLSRYCCLQVLLHGAYWHAGSWVSTAVFFQKLNVSKGVSCFALGGFPKDVCYVGVPLNVCLSGKVEVSPIGLGLARKGVLEAFQGFGGVNPFWAMALAME